ncbi:MAG: FG-GAP-like repeat-containing protein [Bernardetiaceae bacterium]
MKQQKLNSTHAQLLAAQGQSEKRDTWQERCQTYLNRWSFRHLRLSWQQQLTRRTAQAAMTSGLLLTLGGAAEAQEQPLCTEGIRFERVENDIFNIAGPIQTTDGTNVYTYSYGSPAFGDIDGDGDLDLFVGTNAGGIKFFENTGDAQNPANDPFAVNNPFGIVIPAGYDGFTYVDLVDIDNDGDLDLFVGESGGTAMFFQNIGTPTNPNFAAPVFNPFGIAFTNGFTDLELADIDGDGDLDLFLGDKKGYLYFQQNTGSAAAPNFAAPVLGAFGLPNFIGGYTQPELADIDGDGDLDLFVGDKGGGIYFYENTGSANAANFVATAINPFGLPAGGFPSIAFADLDQDGDLDAGVGSGATFFLQENQGVPQRANFSDRIFGLPEVPGDAALTFGDIDGDGDIDAFVTNYKGGGFFFGESLISDYNRSEPTFAFTELNPFGFYYVGKNMHPELADIDGDGDLDMFVGTKKYNNMYLFENIGSATNPDFSNGITVNPFGLTGTPQPGNPYITPEMADVDGDGDLDMFSGSFDGNTFFARNIGSATLPVFAPWQTNPFGLTINSPEPNNPAVVPFENSVVSFADIDFDGDLDMFSGGFYTTGILFHENTGTPTEPVFALPQLNAFEITGTGGPNVTSPEMIDFDRDGDTDMFVGASNGDIFYFRNRTDVKPVASVTALRDASEAGEDGVFRIDLDRVSLDENGNLIGTEIDFFIGGTTSALGQEFTIVAGQNIADLKPSQRKLTIAPGATTAQLIVKAIYKRSVDNNTVTLGLVDDSPNFCRSVVRPSDRISIIDLQGVNLRAIPGNRVVALQWDNLTGCDVRQTTIFMGASPDNVTQAVATVEGGATRYSVQGLVNGLAYYFKVVSVCADGPVESQVVRAQPSLIASTEDDAMEAALTLYPNPSNGTFSLRLGQPLSSQAQLTVVSMTGQVVHTSSITPAAGRDTITLNLNGLAAGTYVVQLRTDEGSIQKRLVIRD